MAGSRSAIASLIGRYYREEYEAIFGPLPALLRDSRSGDATPLGSTKAGAAWDALASGERTAMHRVFANAGKALASYQRTLRFEPSRFDEYVSDEIRGNHLFAATRLSEDERAGLALFIGRANCTWCHRGPLLTGNEFFSLGLPFGAAGPDSGRAGAFSALRADPFNCAGEYSDAESGQCDELRFLVTDQVGFIANFKTPSLRMWQ